MMIFAKRSMSGDRPDGHFKGSEGIGDKLIYIVQTDDGVQHTLTPAEFAEKYGWKNDPGKVRLVE